MVFIVASPSLAASIVKATFGLPKIHYKKPWFKTTTTQFVTGKPNILPVCEAFFNSSLVGNSELFNMLTAL